jgi:uncharacterized protein YsxB (DUF464 family)
MITQHVESDQELVKALQSTIEAQQETIDAMKTQNAILKEKQKAMVTEMENLTDDQLDDIKTVINTYINGMRKL